MGITSPRSFLGEFEQRLLLAMLRCGERPRPVDIRRELARVSNQQVSRGAFYTTLDRLEAKKLIKSTTVAGNCGARRAAGSLLPGLAGGITRAQSLTQDIAGNVERTRMDTRTLTRPPRAC